MWATKFIFGDNKNICHFRPWELYVGDICHFVDRYALIGWSGQPTTYIPFGHASFIQPIRIFGFHSVIFTRYIFIPKRYITKTFCYLCHIHTCMHDFFSLFTKIKIYFYPFLPGFLFSADVDTVIIIECQSAKSML